LSHRCVEIFNRSDPLLLTSHYDREKPQEHLVKLAGGVAVIVSAGRPRSR